MKLCSVILYPAQWQYVFIYHIYQYKSSHVIQEKLESINIIILHCEAQCILYLLAYFLNMRNHTVKQKDDNNYIIEHIIHILKIQ